MATNGSSPPSRRRRVSSPAVGTEHPAVDPPARLPRAPRKSDPATGPGADALTAAAGALTAAAGALTAAAGPASAAAGGDSAGGPDGYDFAQPPAILREGLSIPEASLASRELHRGAIGRLDAQVVSVTQGAIGAARADEIEVRLGSVGAALANELDVTQGAIGTVIAGDVHLDQVVVRAMIAREVVVERPSLIGFLVARRVSGDVRVLFDWRGALLFGAVFGLIARVGRRRR